MILDSLENLSRYDFITPEIIDFVRSLNVNTPCGHYELSEKTYANIDDYITRSELECPLEAHRKYIDVQLLIYGTERIDFAVFFPEDAHAPQITTLCLQDNVRKVVIKIAVEWQV